MNFYVTHPDNVDHSASNQHFWKEYHRDNGRYDLSKKIYLVKPALNEKIYCQRNFLKPYRDWINRHYEETFLVGPFKFTSFDGKKSKDRISTIYWEKLEKISHKFENSIPKVQNSNHLVFYLDTPFHLIHENTHISSAISNILFQRYISN